MAAPHTHDVAVAPASKPVSDRVGVGVSVLCLVHCLALPFALTGISAWAATEAAHMAFHLILFVLILPLAVVSAVPGYRDHRDRSVLWLLGTGVALLVLALLSHDVVGSTGERWMTVAGSLSLVAGHVRNWQARRRCAHHTLPHHAEHCE